jgi:hypothetical protein
MEQTQTARQLSKVPDLLQRWKDARSVASALQARAALVDGCEDIMRRVEAESRSMTGDERRTFDCHTLQIRAINADLAEYKRERVADIMAAGFPAEYCRLPY